ncbi:hypothetical protein HaLaN_11716 [Haematococcus lacustris]|uniref:Uncharacterized protein n=1 Tax=Haematococcus lacustris TaxID=44745 RepID=A0A699Z198_HAELA|nr:hypothetical protein HaLaN_11716 [Haematococcus lacustris]
MQLPGTTPLSCLTCMPYSLAPASKRRPAVTDKESQCLPASGEADVAEQVRGKDLRALAPQQPAWPAAQHQANCAHFRHVVRTRSTRTHLLVAQPACQRACQSSLFVPISRGSLSLITDILVRSVCVSHLPFRGKECIEIKCLCQGCCGGSGIRCRQELGA